MCALSDIMYLDMFSQGSCPFPYQTPNYLGRVWTVKASPSFLVVWRCGCVVHLASERPNWKERQEEIQNKV